MAIQTYPVLLSPSHSKNLGMKIGHGKSKKQGAAEMVIYSRINRLGIKVLDANINICIDGHHYEPDLAYIDSHKGVYVDIEIDEPYSVQGKPTHYVDYKEHDKDFERNLRFTNAGWYVMRFSEEQLYCHTAECMKELFELLQSIGAMQCIPKCIKHVKKLTRQDRWTEVDSRKMKSNRCRRKYLGYDPSKMDLSSTLYCIKLLIPIMFQSCFNKTIRLMLYPQLWRYIVHRY